MIITPLQKRLVDSLVNTGYDPGAKAAFNDARDTGANITLNGRQYAVYKTAAGKYYYLQSRGMGPGVGSEIPVFLDDEKDKSIIQNIEKQIANGAKRNYSNITANGNKVMSDASPVAPAGKLEVSATPVKQTNKSDKVDTTKENIGGGGYNLADDPAYKALVNQNKQLINSFNELKETFKRPEKLGAEYWAGVLGEDYNLENILNRYNQKTNDYYDSLVAHNEDTRNRYIRNNYNFLDDTINSYLNSYKQAAPTATNNRAKAATALANSMYGFDYNTDNDYLALQNKNYLEQERKAELAKNPFEAESYYNTMSNYLANIEGQMNTEKVKQYVNSLDAYAQKVAANRAAVSTVYNANAAKYQGLADAASTRATGAANNYLSNNAWQNMYDYYKAITGTDKGASTALRSNVLSSTGRNTSTTR